MSRTIRLAAYYLERLGLSTYRRQLAFYRRNPGPPPEPFSSPAGFDFRFVRPDELEALQYPGGWLTLAEARQWLERGDSDMLAAIREGIICGYLWVERRSARVDYLKLTVPLPAGQVYISKVLVLPRWRRQGLARNLFLWLSSTEADTVKHCACVAENLPMRRLFLQLDWEVRLLLTFWKVTVLHRYSLEILPGGEEFSLMSRKQISARLFR